MNYSVNKNTAYSFAGANVAPSCRPEVRGFAFTFCADTAFAVSVLFSLIIIIAIIIFALNIGIVEICRLTMLAIIFLAMLKFKQTVKFLKRI